MEENSSRRSKVKLLLVFLSFLWTSSILAAPLLKPMAPGVSAFLYYFFSPVCHQIPSRSLYLKGFPLAVCARCFGIYASFFLGGLCSLLLKMKKSPPRIGLVLSLVPVGVDGGLQLLGVWQSTNLLRMLTGGIFGFTAAFYVLPALEAAWDKMRKTWEKEGTS